MSPAARIATASSSIEPLVTGRQLRSDRLRDLAWTMTDASLCGLGQTAGSAVLSALQLWPALFAAPTERLAHAD